MRTCFARPLLLVLLGACPLPPAPLPAPPPSPFNGVWVSRPDDAGLREGILIHDLRDGGVVWSPRRLRFRDGGLIIIHRCTDFTVDGATGHVTAAERVVPAGIVTEGSGGVTFVWTVSTVAIREGTSGIDEVRMSGAVADGSLTVRLDWFRDASFVGAEVKQLDVTRQFACE